MKQNVTKAPKTALCRACHGTGVVLKAVEHPSRLFVRKRQETTKKVCPQCGSSDRVMVNTEIELDIRPYKSREQKE